MFKVDALTIIVTKEDEQITSLHCIGNLSPLDAVQLLMLYSNELARREGIESKGGEKCQDASSQGS